MEKPKSIKVIGIIVSILGGFMMGSNFLGALLGFIMSYHERKTYGSDYQFFPIKYYILMGFLLAIAGLGLLIGGNRLRMYKPWARKLLIYATGLVIITMLLILILNLIDGFGISSIMMIIMTLIMSVPSVLLLMYLHKEKISKHFA